MHCSISWQGASFCLSFLLHFDQYLPAVNTCQLPLKFVEELDFLPIVGKDHSTTLDEERVVKFPTPILHIDFVIPDDVLDSEASLFSILQTVIPNLKQLLRVRILLLQHFKTQGRVFSNQGSMMWEPHNDIYFI